MGVAGDGAGALDPSGAGSSPSVTVVVACHDPARWSFIVGAVDSARRQSRPPAAIVVTVDHQQELTDRLSAELPDVEVVQNTCGIRGASANRNCGAAQVRTDLIAFLDDDELADPEWLTNLLPPFADPDVVGTGGFCEPWWELRRPRWFPSAFAWALGTHDDTAPTSNTVVRNVWSGNMAIRRSVFEAIGGFRTDFGKVGNASQPEDTDLCVRAAAVTGGHWVFVPGAVIRHFVPASRSSFEFYLRRCYNEGQGKILMREKNRELDPVVLRTEKAYLREVVPSVARREATQLADSARRLAAMGLGLAAAAAGGLSARRRSGRSAGGERGSAAQTGDS